LLTLDKLTIRKLDLYGQNRTCSLCNKEEETREHIFKYKKLESWIIQAWKETIKKVSNDIRTVLTETKGKSSSKTVTDLNECITRLIEDFEKTTISSSQKLFSFTIGLIERKQIDELGKLLKKFQPGNRSITTKAKTIMTAASKKFRNNFRKLVWNYICGRNWFWKIVDSIT